MKKYLLVLVVSMFVLSACQSAEPLLDGTESGETEEIIVDQPESEDEILEALEEEEPPSSDPIAALPTASPIPPTTPDFILEDDYELVTLLPFDAIPAIDNPSYYDIGEADQEYDPDELIIGIEFNGETRAYSVPLLSRHEIVNDTVGGVKLSVTW